MANTYLINVQFVNPNIKFEEEKVATVKEAIKNYNAKSLIARNPKKITKFDVSEDEMTLHLTLESEADLPMPTKALRLLSTFLVQNTSFRNNIQGKQLFKMTSENVGSALAETDNEPIITSQKVDGVELLRRVNDKAAALIQTGNTEKIMDFLKDDNR